MAKADDLIKEYGDFNPHGSVLNFSLQDWNESPSLLNIYNEVQGDATEEQKHSPSFPEAKSRKKRGDNKVSGGEKGSPRDNHSDSKSEESKRRKSNNFEPVTAETAPLSSASQSFSFEINLPPEADVSPLSCKESVIAMMLSRSVDRALDSPPPFSEVGVIPTTPTNDRNIIRAASYKRAMESRRKREARRRSSNESDEDKRDQRRRAKSSSSDDRQRRRRSSSKDFSSEDKRWSHRSKSKEMGDGGRRRRRNRSTSREMDPEERRRRRQRSKSRPPAEGQGEGKIHRSPSQTKRLATEEAEEDRCRRSRSRSRSVSKGRAAGGRAMSRPRKSDSDKDKGNGDEDSQENKSNGGDDGLKYVQPNITPVVLRRSISPRRRSLLADVKESGSQKSSKWAQIKGGMDQNQSSLLREVLEDVKVSGGKRTPQYDGEIGGIGGVKPPKHGAAATGSEERNVNTASKWDALKGGMEGADSSSKRRVFESGKRSKADSKWDALRGGNNFIKQTKRRADESRNRRRHRNPSPALDGGRNFGKPPAKDQHSKWSDLRGGMDKVKDSKRDGGNERQRESSKWDALRNGNAFIKSTQRKTERSKQRRSVRSKSPAMQAGSAETKGRADRPIESPRKKGKTPSASKWDGLRNGVDFIAETKRKAERTRRRQKHRDENPSTIEKSPAPIVARSLKWGGLRAGVDTLKRAREHVDQNRSEILFDPKELEGRSESSTRGKDGCVAVQPKITPVVIRSNQSKQNREVGADDNTDMMTASDTTALVDSKTGNVIAVVGLASKRQGLNKLVNSENVKTIPNNATEPDVDQCVSVQPKLTTVRLGGYKEPLNWDQLGEMASARTTKEGKAQKSRRSKWAALRGAIGFVNETKKRATVTRSSLGTTGAAKEMSEETSFLQMTPEELALFGHKSTSPNRLQKGEDGEYALGLKSTPAVEEPSVSNWAGLNKVINNAKQEGTESRERRAALGESDAEHISNVKSETIKIPISNPTIKNCLDLSPALTPAILSNSHESGKGRKEFFREAKQKVATMTKKQDAAEDAASDQDKAEGASNWSASTALSDQNQDAIGAASSEIQFVPDSANWDRLRKANELINDKKKRKEDSRARQQVLEMLDVSGHSGPSSLSTGIQAIEPEIQFIPSFLETNASDSRHSTWNLVKSQMKPGSQGKESSSVQPVNPAGSETSGHRRSKWRGLKKQMQSIEEIKGEDIDGRQSSKWTGLKKGIVFINKTKKQVENGKGGARRRVERRVRSSATPATKSSKVDGTDPSVEVKGYEVKPASRWKDLSARMDAGANSKKITKWSGLRRGMDFVNRAKTQSEISRKTPGSEGGTETGTASDSVEPNSLWGGLRENFRQEVKDVDGANPQANRLAATTTRSAQLRNSKRASKWAGLKGGMEFISRTKQQSESRKSAALRKDQIA